MRFCDWRWMAVVVAAIAPGRLDAAVLEVGGRGQYPTPAAAAAVAHDGDVVRIAAGTYANCAVWKASDLVIEGAGQDVTKITGAACMGKALFIVEGNGVTIRNLTFAGARVPDFNGAGIRVEGKNLTIDHAGFVDNQDGVLAAPVPGSTLIVRDSVFLRNGTCEGAGGCAHGIYANDLALVRIERSRFFETRDGHHIKSRAARTEVIGCDLSDGANGTSSYAIDVPNGGGLVARDNAIQKGPKSSNHGAAISIGAEGLKHPAGEIVVEHNRFLVEGGYRPYLLNNATPVPALLKDNVLLGGALPLRGDGSVR
jgi:hypothetical protein